MLCNNKRVKTAAMDDKKGGDETGQSKTCGVTDLNEDSKSDPEKREDNNDGTSTSSPAAASNDDNDEVETILACLESELEQPEENDEKKQSADPASTQNEINRNEEDDQDEIASILTSLAATASSNPAQRSDDERSEDSSLSATHTKPLHHGALKVPGVLPSVARAHLPGTKPQLKAAPSVSFAKETNHAPPPSSLKPPPRTASFEMLPPARGQPTFQFNTIDHSAAHAQRQQFSYQQRGAPPVSLPRGVYYDDSSDALHRPVNRQQPKTHQKKAAAETQTTKNQKQQSRFAIAPPASLPHGVYYHGAGSQFPSTLKPPELAKLAPTSVDDAPNKRRWAEVAVPAPATTNTTAKSSEPNQKSQQQQRQQMYNDAVRLLALHRDQAMMGAQQSSSNAAEDEETDQSGNG